MLKKILILILLSQSVFSSECLNRNNVIVLEGLSSQFREEVPKDSAIDARNALWTSDSAGNYPVIIDHYSDGNENLCFVGGNITGLYDENTTPWDTYHGVYALQVRAPGFTIDGTSIFNMGDGIGFSSRDGPANDWIVKNVYMKHIHDDCIENDYQENGLISNALLNGCYVGISSRGHSSSGAIDGRDHTMVIKDSLIFIEGTPTVYKGETPGHGGIFKWSSPDKASEQGYGVMLELSNLVIRLDGKKPNHQDYNIPFYYINGEPASYLRSCTNVTIFWEGTIENGIPRYVDGDDASSEFSRWPDCMTMTTDLSVWTEAVAAWRNEESNCIEFNDLIIYLDNWKEGTISITDLLGAIQLWKSCA